MALRIFIACALLSVTLNCAKAATLRLTDSVGQWRNASLDERLTIANALAMVAGHGSGDTDEEFFEHCLDDTASVPRLVAEQIRDAANACLLVRSYSFSGT